MSIPDPHFYKGNHDSQASGTSPLAEALALLTALGWPQALFTIKQAQQILGTSRASIYRDIAANRLEARKNGAADSNYCAINGTAACRIAAFACATVMSAQNSPGALAGATEANQTFSNRQYTANVGVRQATDNCNNTGESITILRARDRQLTEFIRADGSIVDYDSVRLFDLVSVQITDLEALTLLLRRLAFWPNCCVIRGMIADAGRTRGVRRLLRAEKAEVLAALAPVPQTADAAWLHRRFAVQTIHWKLGGYRSNLDAQCIAFNELLDEFRERHGRRWPRWQCAGCDEPIGDLPALTLADENRIHFDEGSECLIRFGRGWRSDAVAGLRALGLIPDPAE